VGSVLGLAYMNDVVDLAEALADDRYRRHSYLSAVQASRSKVVLSHRMVGKVWPVSSQLSSYSSYPVPNAAPSTAEALQQ